MNGHKDHGSKPCVANVTQNAPLPTSKSEGLLVQTRCSRQVQQEQPQTQVNAVTHSAQAPKNSDTVR